MMHCVKSFPELLTIAFPTTPAEEKHDEDVRRQVLTGAPVA